MARSVRAAPRRPHALNRELTAGLEVHGRRGALGAHRWLLVSCGRRTGSAGWGGPPQGVLMQQNEGVFWTVRSAQVDQHRRAAGAHSRATDRARR